jgi:hypothetical protein
MLSCPGPTGSGEVPPLLSGSKSTVGISNLILYSIPPGIPGNEITGTLVKGEAGGTNAGVAYVRKRGRAVKNAFNKSFTPVSLTPANTVSASVKLIITSFS